MFISYKREEIVAARRFRNALRAEGIEVWWDEQLQGGELWEYAIDAALLRATVVMTLWSPASSASEWVKHESSVAKLRGVLVPVRISACEIPQPFASIQAINLVGWDGAERDPGFRDLVMRIRYHFRIRRKRRGLMATAALLLIGVGYFAGLTQQSLADPVDQSNSTVDVPATPSAAPGANSLDEIVVDADQRLAELEVKGTIIFKLSDEEIIDATMVWMNECKFLFQAIGERTGSSRYTYSDGFVNQVWPRDPETTSFIDAPSPKVARQTIQNSLRYIASVRYSIAGKAKAEGKRSKAK